MFLMLAIMLESVVRQYNLKMLDNLDVLQNSKFYSNCQCFCAFLVVRPHDLCIENVTYTVCISLFLHH